MGYIEENVKFGSTLVSIAFHLGGGLGLHLGGGEVKVKEERYFNGVVEELSERNLEKEDDLASQTLERGLFP